MGNQNGKVAQFRMFARQMMNATLYNARTGKLKNGEISKDQAKELFMSMHDSMKREDCEILDGMMVTKQIKEAWKTDSEAGENISLYEADRILRWAGTAFGVDSDEVYKVMQDRDEKLAEINKNVKFDA